MLDSELLEMLHSGAPLWHRDAACRENPDVTFVPARGESVGPALQVCGRCLVRAECLAVALADPDLVGVWGGTTTTARAAMRRAARQLTTQPTNPTKGPLPCPER